MSYSSEEIGCSLRAGRFDWRGVGEVASIGLIAVSTVRAHEKVKLTGYVVDVVCAANHTKDNSEDATKFAGEHTKECALMEECVKSG